MSKKPLARRGRKNSSRHHDSRRLSDSGGTLTELARDGLAEHRLARRANALVLLDRGMSCEEVGRVLLIDDDTIRTWHDLFEKDGVDGLAGFNYSGRASPLSLDQQATLKVWVDETLPTREVGAWIEQAFGVVYESRSGLIALLHRLGLEHRKPQAVSRKLDPAKQQAFIDAYETLLRVCSQTGRASRCWPGCYFEENGG